MYIPKSNNGAMVWLEEEAINIKTLKRNSNNNEFTTKREE